MGFHWNGCVRFERLVAYMCLESFAEPLQIWNSYKYIIRHALKISNWVLD